MRVLLHSSCAISVIAFMSFTAPAFAQMSATQQSARTATEGDSSSMQSSTSADSTSIPSPSESASTGVQDIVVTAQRRSESVQRASLSIAAIGQEQLVQRGVVDAQSLNNVVPGLKIAQVGGHVQTFVRGVGDTSVNAFTQASVSLNIDGVYVARSSAFGPVFFDVSRVEVLRGPQGTLYGRNSSGGAINIISNAPDLSGTSGMVSLEVGDYDLVRGQAVFNQPVSDTFGLRAAVQVTHRDGYLSDGGNDDKSFGGRLRALWEPSPDLTINLIGDVAHIGGYGQGRVFRPVLFNDPWVGPTDPRVNTANFPLLRTRQDNKTDITAYSLSAQVDYSLGGATLTILPAYRYNDTLSFIAADQVTNEQDHSKQLSLELRLAGESGPLKWITGAYGFKEDLSVFQNLDLRAILTQSGLVSIQDLPTFDTKAGAVFGEGTFSLTDRLRIIGGLRYTAETRKRQGSVASNIYVAGVPTVSTLRFDQQTTVRATTWRGGMEYDVADQNMFYATVSRGFKSGGFNATDAGTFGPEYVTAFTTGIKNRFFDNRLVFNVEGFYWKYKDQQVSFIGVDTTGTPNLITRNAGNSTIYGLEVEAVAKPTQDDMLSVGVSYLHTNYGDFRYVTPGGAPAGTLLADGCVSDGSAPIPGTIVENCSGNPLPRAPKWTLSARGTHAFRFDNGSDLVLGGTFSYNSRQYLSPNYRSPNFQQGGYSLFDADLTFTFPNRRWSIQAYARNLTNKAVFQQVSNEGSIAPTTGPDRGGIANIGSPRTFGGRVQLNF